MQKSLIIIDRVEVVNESGNIVESTSYGNIQDFKAFVRFVFIIEQLQHFHKWSTIKPIGMPIN